MARAIVAVALLVIASSGPTRAQVPQRHVLGYYVPYDSTSWTAIEAHWSALSMIGAQWVTVDACGNLSSRDDQTIKRFAQARGVQVLPSLLTLSGWLNHRLLTDESVSDHLIEQIVAYTLAEDYAGFDLDLEAIDPADREAFSAFVARLAGRLHDVGKGLTLAIPAKDRDVTVGWSGAYDYAALALADLITIMAYEYRGPFSGPGSVAPYDWVERVLAFTTTQIPPEKVLLGLAFYGYDWNTTSGGTRSLGYPQAVALAERYAADVRFDPVAQSVTFTYEADAGGGVTGPASPRIAHEITVREAPPCDVTPPPPPPAPTRPPLPVPGVRQVHEVWIEESASTLARLDLAGRFGVGGVAAWRLGLEDPSIWPTVREWRGSGV